jgi:hypothetical protein
VGSAPRGLHGRRPGDPVQPGCLGSAAPGGLDGAGAGSPGRDRAGVGGSQTRADRLGGSARGGGQLAREPGRPSRVRHPRRHRCGDSPDRARERDQPPADPRQRALAGDRDPRGAGRVPTPARPTPARRRHRVRVGRRRGRGCCAA